MRTFLRRVTGRAKDDGQMLIMFAFFVVVLILFVGLGIDLGFAYVTKANLAKAVDAACLIGANNLFQGDNQAKAVARSAFAANYGRPGRDTAQVTPNVAVNVDASNNKIIDVSATATINTFFIRLIPTWQTLNVTASAQATRAKLIMTLVLDRSGSMENNGGADAMPGAVTSFINFFDDNNDRVALATFASHARVDVTMRQPFKQPIINAVNAIFPSQVEGGTFSQGGLTNGLVLNNSVVTLPGENVVRVCVFFTDGLANIIRDSLYCRGVSNPPTDWNFGGFDSGSTVGFFNPTNGVENTGCRTSGGNPTCCSAVSGFRSAISGTTRSFTRANVTADAEYRAVQVANDMRAAGMIVYSIGLGSNINRDFLQQIANDPDLPGHVGTPYDGEAVFAPTAADLRAVFEIIAAKIRLRLTR